MKKLPSPESMRAELQAGTLAPGSHEPSVVQFGCEGCPNGHRFVAAWLSSTRLIKMMDDEEGLPRGFVAENFSSIGKAKACPDDQCQHEETLKGVVARTHPYPEI